MNLGHCAEVETLQKVEIPVSVVKIIVSFFRYCVVYVSESTKIDVSVIGYRQLLLFFAIFIVIDSVDL